MFRSSDGSRASSTWRRGRADTPNFNREEETSTAAQPVIISERLWREQFGASPNALGTVRVDDNVRTIVGLMPAGFALPFDAFIRLTDPVDLYTPLTPWRSESAGSWRLACTAGTAPKSNVVTAARSTAKPRVARRRRLWHELEQLTIQGCWVD